MLTPYLQGVRMSDVLCNGYQHSDHFVLHKATNTRSVYPISRRFDHTACPQDIRPSHPVGSRVATLPCLCNSLLEILCSLLLQPTQHMHTFIFLAGISCVSWFFLFLLFVLSLVTTFLSHPASLALYLILSKSVSNLFLLKGGIKQSLHHRVEKS